MTNVYDSTALSSFTKCPRHFYYRHVKHWAQDSKYIPPAIAFGTAWHSAMDAMWPLLCGPGQRQEDAFHAGVAAFNKSWDEAAKSFSEEANLKAHNAETARAMLNSYVEAQSASLRTFELIGVEVPFIIPLETPKADNSHKQYSGLIDKVVKDKFGFYVPIDHKTTSAYYSQGGFRYEWLERWSPNAQLIGYAYACHLLYGKAAPYAIIDAALVHKEHHQYHKLLPQTITESDINEWLSDAQAVISNMAGSAFPKIGHMNGNCVTPTTCPYKDLCTGGFDWKNGAMPSTFVEKEWKPVEAPSNDS